MSTVAEPLKRRALGKGLESLLPTRRPAEPPQNPILTEAAQTGKPREIPVDSIERNPFQTRTRFDEQLLEELAASIAVTGVVQPILVRPLGNDRYQLIAGERRWLASRKAGKTTIPAMIKAVSDEQAMEMTIVENLQRADLNPMEQARAFERLTREFKMTQEQMAQRTGKNRASIANFLRLLRLPSDIQGKVEAGELTFGHARALLALEDPESMQKAVQKVSALAMSVRQTETFVHGILHPELKAKSEKVAKPDVLDPNVREAQDQLQRALGMKVRVHDKNGRGQVVIEYARLEDFDALLATILGAKA